MLIICIIFHKYYFFKILRNIFHIFVVFTILRNIFRILIHVFQFTESIPNFSIYLLLCGIHSLFLAYPLLQKISWLCCEYPSYHKLHQEQIEISKSITIPYYTLLKLNPVCYNIVAMGKFGYVKTVKNILSFP